MASLGPGLLYPNSARKAELLALLLQQVASLHSLSGLRHMMLAVVPATSQSCELDGTGAEDSRLVCGAWTCGSGSRPLKSPGRRTVRGAHTIGGVLWV